MVRKGERQGKWGPSNEVEWRPVEQKKVFGSGEGMGGGHHVGDRGGIRWTLGVCLLSEIIGSN